MLALGVDLYFPKLELHKPHLLKPAATNQYFLISLLLYNISKSTKETVKDWPLTNYWMFADNRIEMKLEILNVK